MEKQKYTASNANPQPNLYPNPNANPSGDKGKSKKHRKPKRSPVQRATVLILGGGMAGVAAAHTLQAAGMHDFLLLEAADRLGGRVRDTSFCGRTIEEGANWIHGVENNNNPLCELARICQLKTFDTNYYAFCARDSDAKDITEQVKTAMQAVERAVGRAYEVAGELGLEGDGAVAVGPNGSLRDCSLKEAARVLAGWHPRSPPDVTAEYYHHDFMEGKAANEVSLVANLHCQQEEVYGYKDAFIIDPQGFSKVIRHIAQETFSPNDPRLLLNETVTEVHFYLENDARVPDGLPDDGVYVKTATGNKYWARYCIITFPNAVLLSDNVKFQPKLPDWKVRALKQCETAVYDKIFMKFADDVKPFWDPTEWILFVDSEPMPRQNSNGRTLEFKTSSSHKHSSDSEESDEKNKRNAPNANANANSNASETGTGEEVERASRGRAPIRGERENASGAAATRPVTSRKSLSPPLLQQLEQYERARRTSPAVRYALKRGDPYTRGYYTVWQNLTIEGIIPGSNMLMVTLVDEMAKAAELKSDADLKAEITTVLRRMYGENVPEPEAIHCTKWASNPLSLGSFHCMRIGATRADLENLTRGIRNLHFAGDGADAEFHGFLHGAYITGVNKARAVLEELAEEKQASAELSKKKLDEENLAAVEPVKALSTAHV